MSSIFDRTLLDYLTSTSVAAVTGAAGLMVTALAILLLAEREVLGAGPGADCARRRRVLVIDAVVAPLLVAFVAVVIVRFHGMAY